MQESLLPSSTGILTAVQKITAVTAYFTSKQLLLFVFELQDSLLPSSTGILIAIQRQKVATAYLKSKQLRLFVFVRQMLCNTSRILSLYKSNYSDTQLQVTENLCHLWNLSPDMDKRFKIEGIFYCEQFIIRGYTGAN